MVGAVPWEVEDCSNLVLRSKTSTSCAAEQVRALLRSSRCARGGSREQRGSAWIGYGSWAGCWRFFQVLICLWFG